MFFHCKLFFPMLWSTVVFSTIWIPKDWRSPFYHVSAINGEIVEFCMWIHQGELFSLIQFVVCYFSHLLMVPISWLWSVCLSWTPYLHLNTLWGLLVDHKLFLQPLFAIPFPAGPAERPAVALGVRKQQWWSEFMALRSSLCHLQTAAKLIWLSWKAVHDNEDRRIHLPVVLE